jgi:hypothetical protein
LLARGYDTLGWLPILYRTPKSYVVLSFVLAAIGFASRLRKLLAW